MSAALLPYAGDETSQPEGEGAPAEVSRESRLRALVQAHYDFIWRALRGLGVPTGSADDAAQRVFLVVSQKLDEIAVGSERSFLFGTALGIAANARRALSRKREVFDEEVLRRVPDPAPNGERVVEMKEERALLDQVLAKMPDDLRSVFVLFVLEGMPTSEIAELLGLPAGTIASRLRRAREAFHTISKRLQAQLDSPRRSR